MMRARGRERKPWRRALSRLGTVLAVLLGAHPVARAQVTLDGTLGPKGPLQGPDYVISAGMGRQVGGNLFHSFGDFNLRANESATFTGNRFGIDNVIARVTGGNLSTIDGRLSCDIPDANFYLINPSGVMFGPHAALDVHGSFTVTTADYVRLGDTGRFDARTPSNSLLTSAPPSAFGFVGPAPGAVTVQESTLEAPSLSIVGGDVMINGATLVAPAGQLNVASVASAGEVVPGTPAQPNALDVSSGANLGRIRVVDSTLETGTNGGGTIVIRGGKFELENQSKVTTVPGADVANGDPSTWPDSGGDIGIDVDDLSVSGGSLISTATTGGGGRIDIHATNSVSLSGTGTSSAPGGIARFNADAINVVVPAAFAVNAEGAEPAVSIRTKSLQIADGAVIESSGAINPLDPSLGSGPSGAIGIDVTDLNLSGGGAILSATLGDAPTGNITVRAANSVHLTGEGSDNSPSMITSLVGVSRLSNTAADVQPAGGSSLVSISAPNVRIDGGAVIASSTGGVVPGANVDVEAGDLTVDNGFIGGTTIATTAAAKGGDVSVRATGTMTISNGGALLSQAGINEFDQAMSNDAQGDAGTLTVSAPTLNLQDGAGIVSTSYAQGRGGDVSVTATNLLLSGGSYIVGGTFGPRDAGRLHIGAQTIQLNGESGIFSGSGVVPPMSGLHTRTDASNTTGNGGALNVTAGTLSLDGDSVVSSETTTSGNGGKLTVDVGTLQVGGGSRISAATVGGSGAGGELSVSATGGIRLSGRGPDGFASGIYTASVTDPNSTSATEPNPTCAPGLGGPAGNLSVSASSLTVENGATVSSDTTGVGPGGNLAIAVDDLVVRGGSISAGTHCTQPLSMAGAGGDVTIDATHVSLTDGAAIGAQSDGEGNAGKLTLHASADLQMNDASVSTAAAQASGGRIEVSARQVMMQHSAVSTSVANGEGNGGDIVMSAPAMVLNQSAVVARAADGNGGHIDISSNAFIASADTIISATSNKGISGTVDIRSPDTNITGALATLPQSFLHADALLNQRCAGARGSSFVVAGRETLPIEPDTLPSSALPAVACP